MQEKLAEEGFERDEQNSGQSLNSGKPFGDLSRSLADSRAVQLVMCEKHPLPEMCTKEQYWQNGNGAVGMSQ